MNGVFKSLSGLCVIQKSYWNKNTFHIINKVFAAT